MANPTFNGFSLQDSNWITERVIWKGFTQEVTTAKINRREGIKILATDIGGKEVKVEGVLIASSAANLQSLIDSAKVALLDVESDLEIEDDRTFTATVKNLMIPDEHYNQSRAPYEIVFVLSDPYAIASQVSATIPIPSGITTISGTVTISGTYYARPTIVYTPGSPTTGNTAIQRLDLYHTNTGQTTTVSGFGSGKYLSYANEVTINLDTFISLEGASAIDNSGSFPQWEPGVNEFTLTVNGNRFPGGSVTVSYQPRYI